MNEKIPGTNVSEQYVFFMNIKVYIVFIQEIWVQIYGYFWVQSLCLLPHSSRVNQIHVMWSDAATEALEPAGSTPDG